MTRTLVKSTLAMALLLPLEAPLIEAAQQFDAFVRFLHRLPVPTTAQHLDLAAGDPLAQRAHRLRRCDDVLVAGHQQRRPGDARYVATLRFGECVAGAGIAIGSLPHQ